MFRFVKYLALLGLFSFPAYNTTAPLSLQKGVVVTVWSAETPTPGNGTTAASQQIALSGPFAVDLQFAGAPGAFEVDVQVAAVDSDTNYQTVANGNITTVDSTNNTAHFDGSLVVGRFARLLMRSRGNAVSVTATVTGG